MKWHHSLYWRIAIGFVGCLALLLGVQALLFVWVIAQSGRTVPNQPPERFAQTVAFDASGALERDPAIDLATYIRQEYDRDSQPFFILRANGEPIEVGGPFDQTIVNEARERFTQMQRMPAGRFLRGRGFGPRPPFEGERGRGPGGPEGRPDQPPGDGPPFEAGPGRGGPPPPDGFEPPRQDPGRGRGLGGIRPMPIVAAGALVGVVVVPPQAPFRFLLARYGPVLGIVAALTLVVGAVIAALTIFGPARARLRDVEDAARRLGAGDLTARAPEKGGDEVSAVATAFNAMASHLAARDEALRAADRARRQLLADVSHELNTPMTAIRGYLDTLAMPDMTLPEETRQRYLGIVTYETTRLERIIKDLLELARLEDGGSALHVGRVSVPALFERVVERHEIPAEDADVRFAVSIDPGLSEIPGDRDRLEQALQNLSANALRYAPAGSAVELSATRVGSGVRFGVTNGGPGIAPEHLAHLFDRFYRAEASRARAGGEQASGSGLGLSIVKAIVERHGGTIGVDSAPGRTTFHFTLPA